MYRSKQRGGNMSTVYFSIEGIRCASCIANIERSLRATQGVEQVSVSLVSSKAEIVYDETKITVDELSNTIRSLGYIPSYISISEVTHIKREEQAQEEYIKALLRKLIICLSLTLPLVIVSMVTMHADLSFTLVLSLALLQLILVSPVIMVSLDRCIAGMKALYAGKPTMDSLIVLGVGAAFLYSIYQTGCIFLGDIKRYSELYFESAGTILTLVLLGEYLEKRAKHTASKSLSLLVALTPTTATKICDDGSTKTVPVTSLGEGDIVLVQQGISIPVDGVILQGDGTINEAMLTGESVPVFKTTGENVYAGTMVMEGVYRIRTNVSPDKSRLHQLILAVEKAQQSKAPIARFADIASQYFIPMVCCLALLASAVWYIYTASFAIALRIAITTLIIACPCAMGLATPLSLVIAMGRATKYGIVIKNSIALQQASRVNTVFLDKTGTITSGTPRVDSIYILGSEDELSIMKYIAPVVHHSSHPITKALEAYTHDVESPYSMSTFEYTIGRGITAVLQNRQEGNALYCPTYTLHIGSEYFMREAGIYPLALHEQENIIQHCTSLYLQGASPLYIAKDNMLVAILGLKDTVREDAHISIAELQSRGIRCVILSGDIAQTTRAIANEVGIERVYGGLLPEEKASIIQDYITKGHICMMVGDGVNDALALSVADIGVAMGKGVDIAQDASAIVFLNESLSNIYTTIMLSKATIRNIKQNLFWAFFYNIISLPIAVGALYFVTGSFLTPMLASAAMVFSSLSVVGNALRLQYTKL